MNLPVLIVGAGPSGLTLASVLAQHGVPFRLIDNDPGPVNQSRAAIVHVRTLELWDKLGLAQGAIEHGVKVWGVNLLTSGKRVAHFPLASKEAEPTPFPFALVLGQSATERLLATHLEAHGQRVEWNTELIGFTPSEHFVRAVIRHADGGLQDIAAQYIVGADGARSLVRRILNINFPGSLYEQSAFLADVHLEPAYPPGNINLNLANGGFVGILPLEDGKYRLFGALSPQYAARFSAQEDGRAVKLGDLQRWFQEYFHLGNTITRAEWTTIYRIHHRLADTFRMGRCFLIGDAGHLHAPAGGQGMNLGVGDAYNLGWKLALVLRGEAHPELLNSYEPERRSTAQAVVRGADRGFELEATENPWVEGFRLHLLPGLINIVARLPGMRRVISELFSQTWIKYRESSAVQGTTSPGRGPRAGDRAPYGVFETGAHLGRGVFEVLRGPAHHLLVFEGHQPGPHLPPVADKLRELLAAYRVRVQLHLIASGNQELHARYAAKTATVCLVRPDGHLAYRGSTHHVEALQSYLDHWYPRRSARAVDRAAPAMSAST